MKTCTRCQRAKPRDEFGAHKRSADGLNYYCRPCAAEQSRENRRAQGAEVAARRSKQHAEWVERNRDHARDYDHRRQLRRKYGLTPDDYQRMLAEQGGACAICGSDTPGRTTIKNFCVDHDHETGTVRGLLCDPCNRGLGLLGDCVHRLGRAVLYLVDNSDREVFPA